MRTELPAGADRPDQPEGRQQERRLDQRGQRERPAIPNSRVSTNSQQFLSVVWQFAECVCPTMACITVITPNNFSLPTLPFYRVRVALQWLALLCCCG